MCGIAGFARSAEWGDREIAGMLHRIAHRGPDDSGVYIDDAIAIGNTLLAIVDIGRGHQPMVRQYGQRTLACVYNGEIYNYRELRKTLEDHGFRFETSCDTEVALAAFAEWGPDAVTRFDGQWALAVWDVQARRLWLTRDPFGIKPLFFHRHGEGLAFASEPKAILSLPDVPRRPDTDAIAEYFVHGFAFAAGYSLNHRSFFAGIESLPPGHELTWTRESGVAIHHRFHYPAEPEFTASELADVPDMLGAALTESVEASMMGDAPIGVALSGGLDSSVIAAVAAHKNAADGNAPLLASCISYRSQARNEDAEHARLLADWLGPTAPIRLVFSTMDPDCYLADLDSMIRHFDEPHWEVKQLAMFNNYRMLKNEGATVVLTGEGSDELFFGYFHRFPGFKSPVLRSAADFRNVWRQRLPVVQRLLRDASVDRLAGLQELAIERHYVPSAAQGLGPERCMQHWYLATFLHWLLLDNDRCSMAFSLEGRFPFLNRRVFETALRIPPAAQIGGDLGEEKLMLRQAFRQALPESIWRHRRKAPLPSPLKLSFHQLIETALRDNIVNADPAVWEVLDRDGVEAVLSAYSARIAALAAAGAEQDGGEELTKYLRLDEPWSVRTPHAFGLLSFFRWWHMNFEHSPR
jgi:asparagine synthase (glutamine-hydrolysing)